MHHLACQWSRQGHEVCVMNTITDKATHPDATYSVKRFRMLRGTARFGYHRFPFQGFAVRSIAALLRDFRPDLVSAHFGYPTGVWLSRIRPLPRYLITCHGGELTKFYWGYRQRWNIDAILRDALNDSVGAIAISSHARKLMEEIGVRPDRILDIPNGVDLDKFKSRVDVNIREKLGLPADSLIILSVGRNHPQKAYGTGIRAFAKVAARAPQARYVIVGRWLEEWQPLVKELELEERVILCPGLYGDELIAMYQQADIFFSPSIWEMFALVVIEAMAAGLPAVVTNISGSQDAIHTGDNGIVVEPDRPDEMADALLQLIENAPLRRQMGTRNLERSKLYGWDRVSRQYIERALIS
ncbi:MAG: glycosyltransferase family 4 protein [Phycisphaerae bacterium]|jgi:glycosyltransferase involved in cell wall biosynthesis|nr:glycosyltransferase family 4 protein [Phycisphaerae bacterium]